MRVCILTKVRQILGFESSDPGAQFSFWTKTSQPWLFLTWSMSTISTVLQILFYFLLLYTSLCEDWCIIEFSHVFYTIKNNLLNKIRTFVPLKRAKFSAIDIVRDNMVAIFLHRWQWTADCQSVLLLVLPPLPYHRFRTLTNDDVFFFSLAHSKLRRLWRKFQTVGNTECVSKIKEKKILRIFMIKKFSLFKVQR